VSVEASKERDKISRRYYLHGLKTLAKLFDISIQTYVSKTFQIILVFLLSPIFQEKKESTYLFQVNFLTKECLTHSVMKTNMQMLEPN
jgi:hypothetical protein